jgi:SAM-dependent methyltransferase
MPEIASARLSIDPSLLPVDAGKRVLDVGCGDGRHVVEAARRGAIAVGVDYDAGELRKTRDRCGDARMTLIVADAAHLPFVDGAFHAVICTETLEHLPDDVGAIGEIAHVMDRGAVLLGAVPSHFTEMLFWKLSRGYREAPGGHVRIYRPRELAGKLAAAGLLICDVRYLHFVDSLFWLRFCLTDFLRPTRVSTAYEQAIAIAVAQERRVPSWRSQLRAAVGASRFIRGVDAVGAMVWPKSLAFVARKQAGRRTDPPSNTIRSNEASAARLL